MDIRDELITGVFNIGEDGRKEPTDWKEYAIKLEKRFKYSLSHSELSAFMVWAYKNSWYIAKNEGEELFWQNYFTDDSISISNLIGLFLKTNNKWKMTPQEKAKDIVDQFSDGGINDWNKAKACAVIYVNGVLTELLRVQEERSGYQNDRVLFWNEVKINIELL